MLTSRSSIPADIEREVFTESGHRCAVCGESCPLERAHIIPWRESKVHKAEDLICLCANCHERADNEKWGPKTLRKYKENPWVRKKGNIQVNAAVRALVTATFEIPYSSVSDEKSQRFFTHALAGFLEEPPDSVKIVNIQQGSIIVTLEMSEKAGQKLLDAIRRKDAKLEKLVANFAKRASHEASGILKEYLPTQKMCRVTFKLPQTAAPDAKSVNIVGDFNNWDMSIHRMEKNQEGDFTIELELSPGKEYQFRYLIDGSKWENDWNADEYVDSPLGGGKNSVLKLREICQ